MIECTDEWVNERFVDLIVSNERLRDWRVGDRHLTSPGCETSPQPDIPIQPKVADIPASPYYIITITTFPIYRSPKQPPLEVDYYWKEDIRYGKKSKRKDLPGNETNVSCRSLFPFALCLAVNLDGDVDLPSTPSASGSRSSSSEYGS